MTAQNPFPKQQPSQTKPSRDMTGVWPVYSTPTVFDWSNVDGDLLRAAFQCASNQGRNIGIGPALGGRGVVITLYMGLKQNPKQYAINANELHELLNQLVSAWSSGSEDVIALMKMRVVHDRPAAD